MDPDLAEEFGSDMLNEHRRLTNATKTGDVLQHRAARCPRCEQRTLVHELGTKHVACTNKDCGRLMTLDEYDQMVIALAGSKASA
jgi:ribosomal protein S27E